MNEIVLYRMPDELTGDTDVVVTLTLAVNGVPIFSMSQLYPYSGDSPDFPAPDPLIQVTGALEQALQTNCVYRDMRPKPRSVIVEGGGVWLRAERRDE
jgi:hypothetical protein